MFNFSPSRGGAHGEQKQHKIFTTSGSQSLKSTGPVGCDKLPGSDYGHLLLSHWALSGQKQALLEVWFIWHILDTYLLAFTRSPWPANGEDMMKPSASAHPGHLALCAWEKPMEATRRHPGSTWGACSHPHAGDQTDPVTAPTQSPVQGERKPRQQNISAELCTFEHMNY